MAIRNLIDDVVVALSTSPSWSSAGPKRAVRKQRPAVLVQLPQQRWCMRAWTWTWTSPTTTCKPASLQLGNWIFPRSGFEKPDVTKKRRVQHAYISPCVVNRLSRRRFELRVPERGRDTLAGNAGQFRSVPRRPLSRKGPAGMLSGRQLMDRGTLPVSWCNC